MIGQINRVYEILNRNAPSRSNDPAAAPGAGDSRGILISRIRPRRAA